MEELLCKNCGSNELVLNNGYYECKCCNSRFQIAEGVSKSGTVGWTSIVDRAIEVLEAYTTATSFTKYDNPQDYAENTIEKKRLWLPCKEDKPLIFVSKEKAKAVRICGILSILVPPITTIVLISNRIASIAGIFLLPLIFIFGIVLVYSSYRSEKYADYLEEMVEYNEKLKERDAEYAKDFAEAENEYTEKIDAMREQEASSLKTIEQMYQYIPKAHFNFNSLYRLKDIFETGRADSLKEAVNIMYSDIEAENRRMEEEEREYMRMEYEREQLEIARRNEENLKNLVAQSKINSR